MARLRALGSIVDDAVRMSGWLVKKATMFFRGKPESMAAFAKNVPALAGRRVTVKSIGAFIKENPLQSLTYLALIPEGISLIEGLREENPDFDSLWLAYQADDTVASLGMDRDDLDEARAAAQTQLNEQIDDLSVSELMNFKDEAAVIDMAIDLMPGRTIEQRRSEFEILRRVFNMPAGNMALYERLKQLQG